MKILARLSILSLVFLFLITLTGCPPDDPDEGPLDGTWILIKVVPSDDFGNGGYELNETNSYTFTFSINDAGDYKYEFSLNDPVVGEFFHNTTTSSSSGTYTYDETANTITFTETEHGSGDDAVSQTFPAFTVNVITFENNTLEIEAYPLIESRAKTEGLVDPWEFTLARQ